MFHNISIQIIKGNKVVGKASSRRQRAKSPHWRGDNLWQERKFFWSNYERQRNRKQRKKILQQITRRQYAQQQAERRQQQQAALQREQAQAAIKRKAVLEKYGALGWLPLKQIRANPFVYEGKVYIAKASFKNMLSRDTAFFNTTGFDAIVAKGVPTTAFTNSNSIILVVRMSNKKAVLSDYQLPLTFGGVVYARYVGHVNCVERNCRDYGL